VVTVSTAKRRRLFGAFVLASACARARLRNKMAASSVDPSMTTSWTERLGAFGTWRRGSDLDGPLAAHIETLGFGAIWVGSSPTDDLDHIESLLDATESITIATGIVNIWNANPTVLARSYHRIAERHPDRFLLGIGVGHPEHAQQEAASRPFQPLVRYLDTLDSGGVPRNRMVLAALGPRVLRLAAERTAGAHPYLVTPDFTRSAREILGTALLATEQRVALSSDPVAAAQVGRASLQNYLAMGNYLANFRRMGFSEEDIAGEGSDHLLAELVVSGDDETVAGRLRAHLEAGADHVAVQLLLPPGGDVYEGYRRLAGILHLGHRR
jgi:probable F420-dependent oxidoreductase